MTEDEITVCPHCDGTRIVPRTPEKSMSNLESGAARYRCSNCGATFDEPRERERYGVSGMRGLPSRLIDADPDAVGRVADD